MRNYNDLQIYRRSRKLAKDIYALTEAFPKAEQYGITSQIKRAAVSVFSNIAEGCSTVTSKHFKKYLQNSVGSLFELEVQLEFSAEQGYCSYEEAQIIVKEVIEVRKMTIVFIKNSM